VVIVKGNIKDALSEDLDLSKKGDGIHGGLIWRSSDGEFAAAIAGPWIVGNSLTVTECIQANLPGAGLKKSAKYEKFIGSDAAVLTMGSETSLTLQLIDMLAHEGHGDTQAVSTYLTETRFTKSGMERNTTSDFGLIGSIIAQLAQD
jgi:hypothetical protein